MEERQRNKAGKLILMILPVYVIKEVAFIENSKWNFAKYLQQYGGTFRRK